MPAKKYKYSPEEELSREFTNFIRHSVVEECAGAYDTVTYDEFFNDKMLIISVIRSGIPYSLFDLIRNFAPFSENDWAKFLGISTKSLHRYKSSEDHYFKPIHSEKIIEIAEVTKTGLDVFGDMDKFRLWLNTPNFALGNVTPTELLKDSYGKEMVISELTRINHGILI